MILNNNNPSDKRKYPDRWRMIKGKFIFKTVDELSIDGSEELLTVSHITGITPRKNKNVSMFKSESLVGYRKVEIGDIASNTMWMWQGAIGVSKYSGVISPAYNVYRQKEIIYDPEFLDYLLREKTLVHVYHSLSTGIRPSRLRLYPDQFLSIEFPVPCLDEQKQIVGYIKWKTSFINKKINEIQKKIELLQEAKVILIQNCVTRGLKTDISYKESGNQFIGGIPENWLVYPLKYVASIYTGDSISDSEKDNYLEKTDIPYIATKDIDGILSIADYDNGLYVQKDSDFRIAPKGASLVCIEGGSAGRKKALLSRDVAFVNKLCAFVPYKIESRYLFYYLSSPAFVYQFRKSMTGMIGGVSVGRIKQLSLPLPTESEQIEISDFLDDKCSKLNNEIVNLQKLIKLLQEGKSSLLTSVLTGDIDTRNIQIPDYEDIDELINDDIYEQEVLEGEVIL